MKSPPLFLPLQHGRHFVPKTLSYQMVAGEMQFPWRLNRRTTSENFKTRSNHAKVKNKEGPEITGRKRPDDRRTIVPGEAETPEGNIRRDGRYHGGSYGRLLVDIH